MKLISSMHTWDESYNGFFRHPWPQGKPQGVSRMLSLDFGFHYMVVLQLPFSFIGKFGFTAVCCFCLCLLSDLGN